MLRQTRRTALSISLTGLRLSSMIDFLLHTNLCGFLMHCAETRSSWYIMVRISTGIVRRDKGFWPDSVLKVSSAGGVGNCLVLGLRGGSLMRDPAARVWRYLE